MPFVIDMLGRPAVQAALGAKAAEILAAALPLQKMYDIMANAPQTAGNFPWRDFGLAAKRCLVASRQARIPTIPKFHLLRHWGQVAKRAGHPMRYSTNLDESHNKAVVKVIQNCQCVDRVSETVLIRETLLLRTQHGEL